MVGGRRGADLGNLAGTVTVAVLVGGLEAELVTVLVRVADGCAPPPQEVVAPSPTRSERPHMSRLAGERLGERLCMAARL